MNISRALLEGNTQEFETLLKKQLKGCISYYDEKDVSQLEAGCDMALQQIEEKRYAEKLAESECGRVIKYGICFCRKSCRLKGKTDEIELKTETI